MHYFTGKEAQGKQNRVVRAKVDFFAIPAGTTGLVIDFFPIATTGKPHFMVSVGWNGLGFSSRPELFRKTSYEELLEEVDMSTR